MEEPRKFLYTAITDCARHYHRPIKFIGTMAQIDKLRDEYLTLNHVITEEKVVPNNEAV